MLMCALLLSSLFSSCANSSNATSAKPADTAAPSMASSDVVPESALPSPSQGNTPPPSPSPSLSGQGFAFEEKTYVKDAVFIKYPQLTGMSDRAVQETLNTFISDTALRDVKDLISGTEYELNYKVTFNSPAVISMYFDGYAYVPETVHPYQFLRTVTIDVARQATVPLPALVSIDEGFVGVIQSGRYSAMGYDMTEEYEAAIKDNLTSMDEDFWIHELRNADTEGTATSSFLTEEELAISVSVPHVMGDHIEIYLPFKALEGYQTDNPVWQEIEK